MAEEFTLGNYIYFIEDPKWVNAFLVSILRTIVGTVLAVFFTSMVAYGLAKRDLMFRKTYFLSW